MFEYTIINDDNIAAMQKMDAESVHSCITDSPWGINFLAQDWDNVPNFQEFSRLWATEVYRVLYPGGFCLAMCGTRTYHSMVSGIEKSGFEIKDVISHIFASGFPKSHKIIPAIDKMMGKESKVVGYTNHPDIRNNNYGAKDEYKRIEHPVKAPTSKEAQEWAGWQTPGLKPAQAFIVIAQKPREGTYAQNLLKYRVGCFNIDATRIGTEKHKVGMAGRKAIFWATNGSKPQEGEDKIVKGRFPANIAFDAEAGKMLDAQSGISKPRKEMVRNPKYNMFHGYDQEIDPNHSSYVVGDKGGEGASRFFFCSKASKKEKNAGLENFEAKALTEGNHFYRKCKECGRTVSAPEGVGCNCNGQGKKDGKCPTCKAPLAEGKTCKFHPAVQGSRTYNDRCKNCKKKFIGSPDTICSCDNPQTDNTVYKMKNNHPTVQSMEFFKYIIKLVCAKGTTVLDPFCGSGTTGCACADLPDLDINFIGIDIDQHYCEISKARIEYWKNNQQEVVLFPK